MKKLFKLLPVLFTFIFVFSFIACNNDDDIKSTKLSSVSYKTKSLKGNVSKAFSSSEIILKPATAKATYTITKITKDNAKFTNPAKGFKIDAKGKVYAQATHKLAAGTYVVTITAKDKSNSKNKKTTTLNVKIG